MILHIVGQKCCRRSEKEKKKKNRERKLQYQSQEISIHKLLCSNSFIKNATGCWTSNNIETGWEILIDCLNYVFLHSQEMFMGCQVNKYRNINERWPEVWITNSCSYSINKLTGNSASLNLLHCFLTNIGKQAEEIIIEEILSSDRFQCMGFSFTTNRIMDLRFW